jgi:hypothetical protein
VDREGRAQPVLLRPEQARRIAAAAPRSSGPEDGYRTSVPSRLPQRVTVLTATGPVHPGREDYDIRRDLDREALPVSAPGVSYPAYEPGCADHQRLHVGVGSQRWAGEWESGQQGCSAVVPGWVHCSIRAGLTYYPNKVRVDRS